MLVVPPSDWCQECASFLYGPAPGWKDWRTEVGEPEPPIRQSTVRLLVRCYSCNPKGRKPVPPPPEAP